MEIEPENITEVSTDYSLYKVLAMVALDASSGEIIKKIPMDHKLYYDLAEEAMNIDAYNI